MAWEESNKMEQFWWDVNCFTDTGDLEDEIVKVLSQIAGFQGVIISVINSNGPLELTYCSSNKVPHFGLILHIAYDSIKVVSFYRKTNNGIIIQDKSTIEERIRVLFAI